ncbi:MAG: chorismate mutase [Chitinispirillaceae bacterium]|nr:chorismate mutase [Chitinispirillaceae bacterium]
MPDQNNLLDLNYIASRLEGLEETIISKLIDRAQFCVNEICYEAGKSGFAGESSRSLFDLRMHYHEQMDALFGRFCAPEERPFTRNLPEPQREVVLLETGLQIDDLESVNFAGPIRTHYTKLIKLMCRPGDDGQYGSSVEHDVYAIQAISRRIHYGAFYIAECKFRGDPDTYRRVIEARDIDKLEQLVTRKEVEDRIIDRVCQKTRETQKGVNREIRQVIEAEVILQFYRDAVIPLTKQGEIVYLLHRRKTEDLPTPITRTTWKFKW